MDILTLYKSILTSLNANVNEEGLVSYVYDGQAFPIMIDGNRLALPTPELLRAGNWKENNLIAFHPLSENLVRGESPVLKKLKGIINLRLSTIIAELLQQLTALAADRNKHSSLPPKAQELLSHMPEADEKTMLAVKHILEASEQEGPNRLIGIYLKRGATFRGNKVSKLAVVSFPILEELESKDHTVFGVKLRKKDQLAIESLIKNYILPGADDLETYSAGSNSHEAPYFDCLLKAYANVAEKLNGIIWLHRKHLENDEELRTDLDWQGPASDLSVYRDMIPTLSGNEGEIIETQASSMVPQKAVSSKVPGILSSGTQKPAAAPVETTQPQRFIQQPVQPVATQPNVPAAPTVVRTARGIDFNSLMQARASAVPSVPYGYPPAPAWAVPANVAPAPGDYAGMHRGIPVNRMGFGMANVPPWAMSPNPNTTMGYNQNPLNQNTTMGFYNPNVGNQTI